MAVSYDEIRRIHRLEKSSSRLVEVNQEFYADLNDFIADEKKKYLASVGDFSSSSSRDFLNMRKVIEEIFSMRVKKIMNAALSASRTKDVPEEGMALQEKKLSKSLIDLLESHSAVLEGLFSGSKHAEGADLNNISVQVLSDIPEFVGTDMKEYGPFKKGEEIAIPNQIAKLLFQRKLAEAKQ